MKISLKLETETSVVTRTFSLPPLFLGLPLSFSVFLSLSFSLSVTHIFSFLQFSYSHLENERRGTTIERVVRDLSLNEATYTFTWRMRANRICWREKVCERKEKERGRESEKERREKKRRRKK